MKRVTFGEPNRSDFRFWRTTCRTRHSPDSHARVAPMGPPPARSVSEHGRGAMGDRTRAAWPTRHAPRAALLHRVRDQRLMKPDEILPVSLYLLKARMAIL